MCEQKTEEAHNQRMNCNKESDTNDLVMHFANDVIS